MLKDIFSKVQEKYNTYKEESSNLENLLNTTTTFTNLFPIPYIETTPSEYFIELITSTCPDINPEKATIIAKIIPPKETYLSITYATELKTRKEYFLITTTNYLFIITTKTYAASPYTNLHAQIIKNNLMSKTILFNNILLEITGSNEQIENFLNIINNPTYRTTITTEKEKYLCGITPTYQYINKIKSGISLNDTYIVFHNKEENLKCTYQDITNYEILLDNQNYLSKNSTSSNKITTFQSSCHQISIRITTKTQTFTMPILEPSTFGTTYNHHDTTFQKNLTFAKNIIDKLNSILTTNPYK